MIERKILLRSDQGLVVLNMKEIHWIEAREKCSVVHCGSNEYFVRPGLQSLENKLDPHQFVRIHRSYLVNVDSIRELKPSVKRGYTVLLKEGTELIWSRHYKDRLRVLQELSLKL
ncbi:LytTR family transcriptional regulator [bacterium]|nr:LytTR family transcriptional regulator [bacterium]MCI0601749.1 LytTR family transcriptional regulator [bacterium]